MFMGVVNHVISMIPIARIVQDFATDSSLSNFGFIPMQKKTFPPLVSSFPAGIVRPQPQTPINTVTEGKGQVSQMIPSLAGQRHQQPLPGNTILFNYRGVV